MANKIKELRQEQHKTLREVAEAVDTSNQNISNWERGKSEPKLATWQKLSDFFGVSVLKLMGNDEKPEVELKNDVPTEVIYKGKKYKVITNE